MPAEGFVPLVARRSLSRAGAAPTNVAARSAGASTATVPSPGKAYVAAYDAAKFFLTPFLVD